MPVRRVFLWTAPRCVSTAFEFSINTLENAKVFHEIFASPFYSGRPLNPLKTPLPKRSYGETKDMLLATYPEKDIVFTKEHAYYVDGRFDMLLEEDMKDFIHTFLIRNPVNAVASSYRGFGSLEVWSSFHQQKLLGFRQLRDLYFFVKEKIDPSPVVIDADDLLENPEGMMKAYCQKVGIEFKEGMTRWEAGSMKTQDFIDQKGGEENLKWNEAAIHSSGLSKSVPADIRKEQDSFPAEVVKCIKEFQPLYQEMHKFRLVLDTN